MMLISKSSSASQLDNLGLPTEVMKLLKDLFSVPDVGVWVCNNSKAPDSITWWGSQLEHDAQQSPFWVWKVLANCNQQRELSKQASTIYLNNAWLSILIHQPKLTSELCPFPLKIFSDVSSFIQYYSLRFLEIREIAGKTMYLQIQI